MKKKIAVFAAGWGSEILKQYINGVNKGIEGYAVDVYLFLCFPLLVDSSDSIDGEINIFRLPNLEDFDGALIFGNSLDFGDIFERINEACEKANIPTVSCGRVPKYGHFLAPDNFNGMVGLCKHLMDKHDVQRAFYIAGAPNNPDSNARFEAIKKVFPLTTDDDVFYTNWDLLSSSGFITDYVKSGKTLPDVFLCANDGLAMLASDTLAKYGIKVPDDVKVVGFDDVFCSSLFDPTLTTVSQNFETIGSEAAKIIIKLNNFEQVPLKSIIPCVLKVRESCGCPACDDVYDNRKKIGHNLYIERLFKNRFDSKLNMLDQLLLLGKEFSDIYERLRDFYTHNCEYENGNIQIMLDPDYENSVFDNDIELRVKGYSDHMYNIFSMLNGQCSCNPYFDTRDIVIKSDSDSNHLYLIMPLHDGDRSMGYFVLTDIPEEIDNNDNIIKYEQRLNSIFVKYRQNLLTNYLNNKLKILNETDPLTMVKNRSAYETKCTEINHLIVEKKLDDFGIAVFDINNLKFINDNYGHEKGDEYIVNSCLLLCNVFKHSPVYRIGGDEFLIILTKEDFVNRDELFVRLSENMDKLKNSDCPDSEKVSVASGISVYDKTTDYSVASVFQRADAQMYENKKRMKGSNNVR